METQFKEIVDHGVAHLKKLYEDPSKSNIASVIKTTSFFLRLVEEEMKEDIMIEFTKGAL